MALAHDRWEDLLADHADALAARDAPHVLESGRLVHLARFPAVPARHAEPARALPDELLARLGVEATYRHQAEALDLVRAGRSVVLATGTSSGKSLVHQVAIADAVAEDPAGTALCLFPTKALAQDQLRSLVSFDLPGVAAVAYDGDSSRSERAMARREATVLLTNPEMVHAGLLPNHPQWARFLARLRVVVVDELHVYRGIFGSHLAHVIRRLRRLAAHYGADPVFVCSSATVGDPASLAKAITGVDVAAVTDDGSPSGPRLIAVWNPPVLDPEAGRRVSSQAEAAGLVARTVGAGARTIGFTSSRRSAEVIADRVRRQLPASRRSRVQAYRGGFLAEERHEIEDALAGGDLDAVIATSALELGIDVSDLEVCVLDGFPGTVASMWQRFGRVGRDGTSALGVLVCGADQLDQWAARHPVDLLARPPELAVVNPGNPQIVDAHLRCAAFEMPLTHHDELYWPQLLDEAVCRLGAAGDLAVRPPGSATLGRRNRRRRVADSPVAAWAGSGWPSDGVGLRSGSPGEVRIVREDGSAVGTVERSRAPQVVHAGAVYLHAGRHHRVVDLDLEAGRALVEPDDGTTTTTARTRTDLEILVEDRSAGLGPVRLSAGSVRVRSRVVGYDRKDVATGELVERVRLELPPSVLETRGVWQVIPEEVLLGAGLVPDSWPGVLHAVEHAAIGVLPLFAICDRWDVGGLSTARHADTGAPTIVIYDGYPGGAGIAELAFAAASDHQRLTAQVLADCGCASGCPSCVQSPKCGNGNEPLDKAGATLLLESLVGTSPVGRRMVRPA